MFVYNKKLQYPIKIDRPNPRLASVIISQYGGPDGELGASLRYLSQRYSMPFDELKGLLTDIGTEELGHVEMLQTMIYQLMKDATLEEIKEILYHADDEAFFKLVDWTDKWQFNEAPKSRVDYWLKKMHHIQLNHHHHQVHFQYKNFYCKDRHHHQQQPLF